MATNEIPLGIAIVVIMLDDMQHQLPERPWCDDPTCGCHTDSDLLEEFLFDKLNDGTLTIEEGNRLYRGRQVCP